MNVEFTKKADVYWKRDDVTKNVINFEDAKCRLWQSQRKWAKQNNVPRTTLQYWLKRKGAIDAPQSWIDFFESPDGLDFLHQLLMSAHFEFTKKGVASIHNVSRFLERCGLSPFIATSYSTQRRISQKMDEMIIEYGDIEEHRLIEVMQEKVITVCEDETFHPDICLVGIEPTSGYILLEEYAEKRDAKTWNNALHKAIKDFPVTVVQVTSDEATGLISHAKNGLEANHSSDLFHVGYEISKGTSVSLASEVKRVEKNHEATIKETHRIEKEKQKFDEQKKRGPGRRPDFEKKIEVAKEKEEQTKNRLETARKNQENVKTEKRNISNFYHPYELETGLSQDEKRVSELLENCFKNINDATCELSTKCRKRVKKAHRVVKNMVSTIEFFFSMIEILMKEAGISEDEKHLMREYLIPATYLRTQSEKTTTPEDKQRILEKSEELLTEMNQGNRHCIDASLEKLTKLAKYCSGLFQRSSSCVEGRNAQLSLRHHGIHRLSNRSLKAQTIIHNFDTRRKDGSTAAERFFEAIPNNMFDYLKREMAYPTRPRKSIAVAI